MFAPGEVSQELEPDQSESIPIEIGNPGDGPLEFSTRIRGARAEGGLWEQMEEFGSGNDLEDTRLQAAIYFQEHFWIAGGNSGANNPNQLYKVDLEGNLVDSWEQASWSNYGWCDLTTDGEFIYAVDSTYIAQIDPETGQVTGERIPTPWNPARAVTWDEEAGLFWVSGTNSDITAVDREGNVIAEIRNDNTMRIYGLSTLPDAPDGFTLFIMTNDRDFDGRLLKANPQTGEVVEVMTLDLGEDEKGGGGEMTSELYQFTWSLVSIMQGPEDWLRTFEAASNFYWVDLEPIAGQVEAGGEMELSLTINSENLDFGATYEAFVQFEHNTPAEGAMFLDIALTVSEPDDVSEDGNQMPYQFAIGSAYPNPFNAVSNLSFTIDRESDISLAVFDLSGRLVTSLESGRFSAGNYQTSINATDWSSGVYLVRLSDGQRSAHQKLTLIK